MKLRVLPIVITGTALLLTLKAAGLMLSGHYAFEEERAGKTVAIEPLYRPTAAARSGSAPVVAQGNYDPITTGSVPPKKAKPPEEPPPAAEVPAADVPALDAPTDAQAKELQNKNPNDLSDAEKALLDRLQSRRQELDGRAQELDMREQLLRAAEKKIEDQIAELKTAEERMALIEQARKSEEEQKLKDLVVMYENMKPKQAAAIFDRLEMKVLVEVTTKMDPKKTGDIIAKMEPEAAERLTVALARRELDDKPKNAAENLPKIEGKKTN